MSVPSGPWKRLNAKQKGALLIALIAIVVAIGSIEGRRNGLDLTNPGLTVPPAVTSTTAMSLPTTTTVVPTTSTALTTTTARLP
jgi:hypothetical protein